jgi:predicted MPP superfamily phosphohydrolase
MKIKTKKVKIFFICLFIIFFALFIHASIEYFEVKNIIPINEISLKKLQKINFNNSKPLKVAVIGDTKEGLQVFYKLVRKAKKNGCHFIIHTGDIVRFNDLRIYHYVYNEMRELIDEYNIPIFVLPGNHDTWGHHKYSTKNFEKFFGKMPLILNIKNNAFVLINDSQYKLDDQTIVLIESYFKSHKINKEFLFAHVPTKDPRPNSYHCLNERYAKKMEDFIKRNNFNGVFFSHIHSYFSYKIGDIPCYISGGGGASLWKGNYHFLQLKIKENHQPIVKRENIGWIYGLNLIDYIKMRSVEWLPFKRH